MKNVMHSSAMHYNAFDLFFVAVSQDKESDEERISVSDETSSDYFADTELSCESFEPNGVFFSNSEGKDDTEKGLTAKLFICLMVLIYQSTIASFGLCHCWSSSGT